VIKFLNDTPVFGELLDIILRTTGDPLEVMDTTLFNRHFYSYEVVRNRNSEFVVCTQNELADHHVLALYTPQNSAQLMVPMKYSILSDYDLIIDLCKYMCPQAF